MPKVSSYFKITVFILTNTLGAGGTWQYLCLKTIAFFKQILCKYKKICCQSQLGGICIPTKSGGWGGEGN